MDLLIAVLPVLSIFGLFAVQGLAKKFGFKPTAMMILYGLAFYAVFVVIYLNERGIL